MIMEDASDDDISTTSTVESEQKSEYEVETVLAEHEFPDGTRYLVQWAGYPLERCTWEPASSFSATQTLSEWNEKKREVAEGKQTAFDVTGWETRVLQLEREKNERRHRRAAKRRKAVLPTPDHITESGTNSKVNTTPATDRKSDNKAPCYPDPGSNLDTLHSVHPSTLAQVAPSLSTKPPVLFGTSQSAPETSRPRKASNHETSKMFNLSTRWKYEKSKNNEPTPNINQLELMRPSEWASLSAANTTKLGNSRLGSLTANEAARDQVDPNGSDFADALDSAHPFELSTATGDPTGDILLNNESPMRNSATSPPGGGSDNYSNPRPSEGEYPPEFPRRKPRWDHRVLGNRWCNRGELVVSMYYGPEKQKIGHARLCGLDFSFANRIYKTKNSHKIEVWFQHLCTLGEYNILCSDRRNYKYGNGWVEGFDDTEPEIYKAAQTLRRDNLIAICYLDNKQRDVLLAYPPHSTDFEFLDSGSEEEEWRYLNLAIRSTLGSVEMLNSRAQYNKLSSAKVNDTVRSRQPKSGEVNEIITQNLSSYHDANRSDAGHSVSPNDDNNLTGIQTPVSTPSPVKTKSSTQILSPNKRLSQQNNVRRTEPMDVDMQTASAPANTSDKTTLPHQVTDLDAVFQSSFNISFDVLATPNGTAKTHRAENFYLWFPEDSEPARAEGKLITEFLKKHTSLVYSNRVEEDWERFVTTCKKNIQGVVLFHESFVDYHTVQSLKTLLHKTTGCWKVSLSHPLENIHPPIYFQRLFPHGGIFLITEDFMVHESDATIIILEWFYEWTKKKFPGSWKLMFRPDVLNWLLKQPEPSEESRHGIWLTMYYLITKLSTSTEHGEVLSGVEEDHCQGIVISPPLLPLYGSRTEDDSPDIPKGLSQEYRNTDHLAEFFAGWCLVNCHRFRRFTILTALEPLARWRNWQHLEIPRGAREFMSTYAIDYKQIWNTLKIGKSKSTSSSVEQTPYTPRTPRVLTSSRSSERGSLSSAAQPPPSRPLYPQPYQ